MARYTIHSKGYWAYKNVLMHRVAASEMIGRALDPDEVVHHLDGNPLNNEYKNLYICGKREHECIHRGHHAFHSLLQPGPFMGPFRPAPGY